MFTEGREIPLCRGETVSTLTYATDVIMAGKKHSSLLGESLGRVRQVKDTASPGTDPLTRNITAPIKHYAYTIHIII
jgi:hypothetical protein